MIFWKKIMSAQTALNTLSEEIPPDIMNNAIEATYYFVATGTVAGGAVQVEEAHESGYTGGWAPQSTPTTVVSDAVRSFKYTVGVGQVARARISTAITGGASLDIWAMVRSR